jgi:TonB family protein
VHVTESDTVDTPVVIGWWRPVIVLPLAALSGLTPDQIDAILTHELAHIRRHDYLANVLQHVTETLLFYHPAVWWVSHHMRIEREQCCDAVVVDLCGDPLGYAVALTHLEEARSPNTVLAIAATDGRLPERIRRVLGLRPHHHRSTTHALVTAAIVTALVLVLGGGYRWSIRTLQASGRAAPQHAATVIATVNGESVTQMDLDHFRPLHGEAATAPLSRVLVELIDERLVAQRGRQLGFTVKDGEVQDAVVYLKRQRKVQTDAQLEAQLAKQHLTMSDLQRHLERAIIAFHVRDGEAFDRVVVTDDEARRYFDGHLGDFPLQTFESVRADLVTRLRREKLGSTLPESYLQSLRVAATIIWMRPEIQRAYDDGLRQRTNPVPSPTVRLLETAASLMTGSGLKAQTARSVQSGPNKDILFDTKGVDFGPWLGRFIPQIKQRWNVPSAGQSSKGHVIVQFNVQKDGSITDVAVVGPSGIAAFDKASAASLTASNPTMPLPQAYPSETALFMVTFHYNE